MRAAPPTDRDPLNTLRLLQILAGMSVVFLAALASAPVRPYFAEWRSVQAEYNRLAVASGAKQVPVELKQIWRPALGTTDRCVTCHLGMAGMAAPIAGHAVFGSHPAIPHDERQFGCTVCHGGQGRATSAEAAHGFVSHWDEQMLDRSNLAAGCGTCHDQFPVASRATILEGARLVERLDCLSCHRIDGRGRGEGPDLTYAGLRGFSSAWHANHLGKHKAGASPAWQSSYGPVADRDLRILDGFFQTRVGAPRIVEARAVAFERGCLGCHKVGGLGGDQGPPLDAVGRKPVGDLGFAHVEGEETVTNYVRAHLIDPPGVVPGSPMPAQDYTPEEVDLLTSWVLFLRSRSVPAAFLPKDRARRELLREGGVRLSSEQSFAAYCSACHGPRGEGRAYGNATVRFPSIGSADFLNVVSDSFILTTLTTGRPGRQMPALAGANATLTVADGRAIVELLRTRLPSRPSLNDLRAASSDPARGSAVYRDQCAACHGDSGEGTPLGSPLSAADRTRDDARDYAALVHGVEGTAMSAYGDRDRVALASVLRHIQAFPRTPASRASWRFGRGSPEAGAPVYERTCAGCHGASGEGRVGPALSNPALQQVATTEFLAATIVRGRTGTPMPSFGRDGASYSRLTAREVLDVAAYVREQLAAPGQAAQPPATAGGR